jgi:chromosome segregation protein
MAEVTLTMVDPEAYEGPIPVEPEVVVEHDGPADWDEDEVRRQRASEAEEIIANEQPGQVIDDSGAGARSASAAERRTGEGPQAVVLKIRRRKFQRTPQKGEIVITRRLFRTGESEYLLNGKLCRLRDIQDIFMGTGLGPESYAIIGQERIGQLLSSKPHDRRAIIEEAAGITRFKTKKRLAELRLESAKQNLARVDDIFEEVTRQMNSLKRQAAKAERFAAVRDELRGTAARGAGQPHGADGRRAGRLEQEIAALTERINARRRRLSSRKPASTRSPSAATSWTARARRRRTAPTKRPSSWSGPRRGSAPTPSASASWKRALRSRRGAGADADAVGRHRRGARRSSTAFLRRRPARPRPFARRWRRASRRRARRPKRSLRGAATGTSRRHAMHLLTLAGNARNHTAQAKRAWPLWSARPSGWKRRWARRATSWKTWARRAGRRGCALSPRRGAQAAGRRDCGSARDSAGAPRRGERAARARQPTARRAGHRGRTRDSLKR